jgi:WD40 repeat protein
VNQLSNIISISLTVQRYEFPIEPWCDFQIEGQAPTWASGHPKEWFRDPQSIELPRSAKAEGRTSQIYKSIHSAISPDDKLLAVTSEDGTRILIYDIDSKELRQKLDGTGKIVFAPLPKKEPEPNAPASNAIASPAYMLVSGIPGIDAPKHAAPNLIIWELDRHGRLLDEEEEVDASAFATKAVESITAQLEENHEWSKEFIASSDLHADFESALKRVAANHRRRHYATLSNAALPGFGALPFSSDGKFMLYHQGNHTDRKNASVIVWDVKAGKEVLRLTGHTDVSADFLFRCIPDYFSIYCHI